MDMQKIKDTSRAPQQRRTFKPNFRPLIRVPFVRFFLHGDNRMPEETVDAESYPLSHLAYVGLAVSSWADLEFEIDFTIWDLMDCPQALSACLTAQLVSPIPKLNALQSLLQLYKFGEELETRLSQFAGSVAGLNELRNRIVHDKRIYDPETKQVRRINVKAKAKLEFMEQPEAISDLIQFCRRATEARSKFIEIRDAIIAARDVARSLPVEQRPPLPRIVRGVVPGVPTNGVL
jgi:hypothetical protein